MEEKTTPDFNLDINLDIQLKRYPVDNLNNNIDIVNKNGEILPKYIGNINDLYPFIENMFNDLSLEQNTKTHLINKLIKIKNEKKKIHVRNKNFNDNSYYLKYYNKQTYNNVSKYLETDIKLFNFKNNLNVLKN